MQPTSPKHGWPDIGTTKISVIAMPPKMKKMQNDIRYEYMYNSFNTNIFPKSFLTIILFLTLHQVLSMFVTSLSCMDMVNVWHFLSKMRCQIILI